MHRDLRDKIKAATEESGITRPDFIELLRLIDEHYDKMEATITQSLQTHTQAPIEAIFDSITDPFLSVGKDGVIRNCNKVCSRYFGRERRALIGTHISEILPELGDQDLGDYLAPFMANLEDTHFDSTGGEVVAQRADGSTFHARINASTIEAVMGEIFVVSLRDISDRRKAEIALRENEERYRALVENAPEAIIVFDVDENRFVDVNDNACTLFNLSRARLLTVGPEAISPKTQPDGSPSFGVRRGYIDAALGGEHPTFEWLHKDSNGREIPCEVRFSRLPSDERRLIRVSITDIEVRKRAEALSHAQNKVLEMIAASAPHDRTLRAICRFVERIGDGFKAAIMHLDAKSRQLSVEQAPSLPEDFKLCLDFVDVGPDSLTCGSAVYHTQDRITANLDLDPGWSRARKAAAQHGIGAAWSFLLHGAAGRIIGTLDVYADEARAPTTDELDRIGRMARLAGIAIKRQLDEQRLRTSEARYRGLFENTVDGVYIASREGDIITANPALVDMLGYDSVEDLKAAGQTTVPVCKPDRSRTCLRTSRGAGVRTQLRIPPAAQGRL